MNKDNENKKNKTIILRINEEMYNEIIKVKREGENLSETVRRLIEYGLEKKQ